MLRSLIRRYPELAERLMLQLIARLRHATRTIHSLALEGVLERVTALLEESAVTMTEHAGSRRTSPSRKSPTGSARPARW